MRIASTPNQFCRDQKLPHDLQLFGSNLPDIFGPLCKFIHKNGLVKSAKLLIVYLIGNRNGSRESFRASAAHFGTVTALICEEI